jgi:NDP-sugar pyrophosphorylase family protein
VKVAIFAGGKGSRLIEETTVRPKPLVEIGHRPLLWHIMQHYSVFGHHHFVLALGYMGSAIKKYMAELPSTRATCASISPPARSTARRIPKAISTCPTRPGWST